MPDFGVALSNLASGVLLGGMLGLIAFGLAPTLGGCCFVGLGGYVGCGGLAFRCRSRSWSAPQPARPLAALVSPALFRLRGLYFTSVEPKRRAFPRADDPSATCEALAIS